MMFLMECNLYFTDLRHTDPWSVYGWIYDDVLWNVSTGYPSRSGKTPSPIEAHRRYT